MSNKTRGTVTVEALGKTWTLKLGTNALCELEGELGASVDQIGKIMSDPTRGKVTLLRTVIRAALTDHHEGIGVKEVGAIIDDIGFDRAMELMQQALTAAMPEAKGGANPRKAAAA